MDASEARAYAEEIGGLFLETSAKANRNVQELFVDISRRLPGGGYETCARCLLPPGWPPTVHPAWRRHMRMGATWH